MNDLEKTINELKEELGKITLVAVSKTKSNDEIMNVYNLGIRDFGENYVQELVSKMDSLPSDIKWHMIGHLQTNKVKDIVKRNIYLIESVDSIKLANVINKEAIKNNKIVNILIEANIANDINKTGCKLEDLDNLINYVKTLSNIKLLGLMAIAPNTNDTYLIKESFKKMNELKNTYQLELLSIGMSSDYKLAIEVGTNIVRIGTKIFGARNYGGSK
jgi:pyridoxal phosphate enzyme (YggS family)